MAAPHGEKPDDCFMSARMSIIAVHAPREDEHTRANDTGATHLRSAHLQTSAAKILFAFLRRHSAIPVPASDRQHKRHRDGRLRNTVTA